MRGAVVIAVPFVGAAFDTFVGTFGTNIAMERMGIFLEELRQRIATLEEARRDRAVTEADLVDATIRGVRGALETGDRDKVRMIASVLVGATSVERQEALDTESVMASLISLTPADLAYARRLAEAMREKRSSFIEYSGVPPPIRIDNFAGWHRKVGVCTGHGGRIRNSVGHVWEPRFGS